MKKIFFFLIFLLSLSITPVFGQEINETVAREVLGYHFVSLNEARLIFLETPENLPINYPYQVLRDTYNAWLIPVKSNGIYEYKLVCILYPNSISTVLETQNTDTLNWDEAKMAIVLLSKTRPGFAHFPGSISNFEYVFRTKEDGASLGKIACKKTLAYHLYDDEEVSMLNLPKDMFYGSTINDCFFYSKGNGITGPLPLPRFLKNSKNIMVRDLIYIKP